MSTSKISVPSYGAGKIIVEGLTTDEVGVLRAAMLGGHHWVRGNDGRLEKVPSFENLPDPVVDEEMLPFWRKQTEGNFSQNEIFGFDEGTKDSIKHSSPSIHIHHLCGYNYTPEYYKKQAEKLTSWGFECMRSKRGKDGKFWETWYLPGLWAAEGQFKEVLKKKKFKDRKEELESALEFIRVNASFGSLDVCVQRIAMVMSD